MSSDYFTRGEFADLKWKFAFDRWSEFVEKRRAVENQVNELLKAEYAAAMLLHDLRDALTPETPKEGAKP